MAGADSRLSKFVLPLLYENFYTTTKPTSVAARLISAEDRGRGTDSLS
jgi:hypothetical protein